eukprot:jgi/Astpho2/6107/Aster-04053
MQLRWVLLCCSFGAGLSDVAGQDLFQQGLVAKDITYESILEEHDRVSNVSSRRLQGNVLGYVTPWNAKGYDVAEIFRSKLTHVSPVWLQLREETGSLAVTGQHDIDKGWVQRMRKPPLKLSGARDVQDAPRVVPRLIVEMAPEALVNMLTKASGASISLLTQLCKQQGFDGLVAKSLDLQVLEAWSQWGGMGLVAHEQLGQAARLWLRQLADALHAQKASHGAPMELLLAVPPVVPAAKGAAMFSTADFALFGSFVDGFSVMDLSDKFLMGLTFYGMDYKLPGKGTPIVGHEYLTLLAQHTPGLGWDSAVKRPVSEHIFDYVEADRTGHRVYYPSLLFIHKRLQLAERQKVGISIWELGQGLDYFMELF